MEVTELVENLRLAFEGKARYQFFEHGAPTGYYAGCRCDECKEWRRSQPRRHKPINHGTRAGYSRGCRCDECRAATRKDGQKSREELNQRSHERTDEMRRLRFVDKLSLQEVADKYNISRERVRQLIGNTGKGYKTERLTAEAKQHPEMTNSELASLLSCAEVTIMRRRRGQRHAISGGALSVGTQAENYISQILTEKGIGHQLMPHKHSFDILLDNGLRLDVKCSNSIKAISHLTPCYTWNLRQDKRGRYADFFICMTADTKEIFVIPADETRINSPVRFCYPTPAFGKKSKWLQYHNAFDLLKG